MNPTSMSDGKTRPAAIRNARALSCQIALTERRNSKTPTPSACCSQFGSAIRFLRVVLRRIGAREFEKGVFERTRLAGLGALSQLVRGVVCDEFAVVEDTDCVGDLLDDREDVRREKYRRALVGEFADEFADSPCGARVKS